MSRIRLLGAEAQASSSFALAYRERQFDFVTDQAVADGWDLPNVRMSLGQPGEPCDADECVPLCPRWLPAAQRQAARLSVVMPRLAASGASWILPVLPQAGATGQWVIKGDAFHRPDAPMSGTASSLDDVTDTHGCGLVFQAQVPIQKTFLVMGRRLVEGDATLGVLEILAERFFRIDVIQAAKTVDRPDLVELSLAALEILGHAGWFSLTWLDTDSGPCLASFRPVPRAGLLTLREARADLLAVPEGVAVARAGKCFMAYPHYSSYGRLCK